MSIELLFNEVSKFFNRSISTNVVKKHNAERLLQYLHEKELEGEKIVRTESLKTTKPMTDLDLCIEKMKRFYKYFGTKNIGIPD